jgi:carboxyl-terminal processing protease
LINPSYKDNISKKPEFEELRILSKLLTFMRRIHLIFIILIPLIYFFGPWGSDQRGRILGNHSFFSSRFENPEDKIKGDSLSVLPLVMQYVKRYYVDQSAVHPKAMLIKGLEKLERTLDEVLVDFPDGERSPSFRVQVMNEEKTFDMSRVYDLSSAGDKVEEVFSFIAPRLASKEQKTIDVEYSVIDEMLKTLDTHSGIIPPQVYKEFMIETEGSFGGLGIVIGIRDGQLTVISPIEGTPAYNAGIKPNDRIVQIEDESTINMSLIEAVGKLRGPKGTIVNIHIMREGLTEPKKFSIVRDVIKIESVEAFSVGDGIGYIRIRDFQKNTLSSLRENLSKLARRGDLKGLILDLRGNPGGLLDQAERISDLFLRSGVIVTTKVGDSKKSYRAREEPYDFNGKVVVLVDSGSASASEIVAGALKNNERAVLVGERTFGKGSVQQIFDLNDDSALKLTIASYLTPGDISIQDTGITPDIMIHPVVISKDKILFNSSLKDERREGSNGQRKPTDKPIYSITYLETSEVNKDEGEEEEQTPEEALSREEKRKKLENDFYVKIAKEIILSSASNIRKEILAEIKGKMNQISTNEERKIEEKWQSLGIDWTIGDRVQGTPKLSIRLTPTTGPGIATTEGGFQGTTFKVKAGEKFTLTAEVENTGTLPLYRLTAVTKSENLIFSGKEFIFGKLNPGEKRNWNITFEIPKWVLTREDAITLKFSDAYETKIPDFSFKVETQELPRPVFAFNYEVVDDGRFGSYGNGNGIPEVGETIGLLIRVKNIGKGISEKSVLMLKNLSGDKVFLKKGRAEFTNLGPGDVKEAVLNFDIKKSDSKIDMELQVLDDVFKEGITDKISIAEKSKEKELLSKRKDDVYFADSLTLPLNSSQFREVFRDPPFIDLSNPPLSTTSDEITLKGLIKDKDGLTLISVFVGDDKVSLLPTTDKEVPISLKVKLKDEINLITILAKDSEGLLFKKSFVVRKEA